MTIEEVRVAVRVNAEVRLEKMGITGYVYQILWTHEKGKEPYFRVGIHDLNAPSVYIATPEDLTVTDWKVPAAFVRRLIEEKEK